MARVRAAKLGTMRHPLNTPIGRFHVQTLEEGADRCSAAMPIHDLVNPITGAPSLAALTVLLDHVGGLTNHHRRGDHQWTVSSELSLDLTPDAESVVAANRHVLVLARSRPLGRKDATAVSECHFHLGDTVIGSGTVRSFYIDTPGEFAESPDRGGDMEAKAGLTAMMAVDTHLLDGDAVVLPQLVDPVLNNSIDVVHGGIASAGLELVASAAVNAGRTDDPLTTASLRVNFLRQFFSGAESRYVGTALRVGRRTGVAESEAIGADGKVAITARLTAYRC